LVWTDKLPRGQQVWFGILLPGAGQEAEQTDKIAAWSTGLVWIEKHYLAKKFGLDK
jgi:hypothetical protein